VARRFSAVVVVEEETGRTRDSVADVEVLLALLARMCIYEVKANSASTGIGSIGRVQPTNGWHPIAKVLLSRDLKPSSG
jgi:hypothetical protein